MFAPADRFDQPELGHAWYQRQPWVWSDGPLPRRRPIAHAMPYSFLPRGMQRSLYGSYVLYVRGFQPAVACATPSPMGALDEARARDVLAAGVFPDHPSWPGFRPVGGTTEAMEDHLCDRVLNGMAPQGFRVEPDGGLFVDLTWQDCTFGGDPRIGARPYELPDVRARFTRDTNRLHLHAVELAYRGEATRTFVPGGVGWDRALVVFRGALVLDAQLDHHLARGHVLCEQVRVAIETSGVPERHPIRALLVPHLEGVDVIDRMGDYLVMGPEGCLATGSALSAEDVTTRIRNALGAWDWKGFRPRDPLVHDDVFARAAGVFWALCVRYVERELPDAAFDAVARAFSDELVASSVPPSVHRDLRGATWTHASELGDPARSSSLSPLQDARDLRAFCAWVVYHATFFHGWVNDGQWSDCGDIRWAPIGLRGRATDDPGLPLEDWLDRVRPAAVDVAYQKLVYHALTRFDIGYLQPDDLDPPARLRPDDLDTLGPPFADDAQDPRLRPRNLRSRLNS